METWKPNILLAHPISSNIPNEQNTVILDHFSSYPLPSVLAWDVKGLKSHGSGVSGFARLPGHSLWKPDRLKHHGRSVYFTTSFPANEGRVAYPFCASYICFVSPSVFHESGLRACRWIYACSFPLFVNYFREVRITLIRRDNVSVSWWRMMSKMPGSPTYLKLDRVQSVDNFSIKNIVFSDSGHSKLQMSHPT